MTDMADTFMSPKGGIHSADHTVYSQCLSLHSHSGAFLQYNLT